MKPSSGLAKYRMVPGFSIFKGFFQYFKGFQKNGRKTGTMDLDLLKRRELPVGSYLEMLVEVLTVMILAISINSGRSK